MEICSFSTVTMLLRAWQGTLGSSTLACWMRFGPQVLPDPPVNFSVSFGASVGDVCVELSTLDTVTCSICRITLIKI